MQLMDRNEGSHPLRAGAADRAQLRARCHVFLTNPDMLHASILPKHAEWAGVLRKLKLIVIDEAHSYNGMRAHLRHQNQILEQLLSRTKEASL